MAPTTTVTTTVANNDEDPFPYMRPSALGKWESFKLEIWNPSTKQFLGRTAKSWGGIVLFYLIFYAALAAFFAVCMQGLLYCLDDHSPKWQGSQSLIGTNPGMGFRPMSRDIEQAGSLIWYTANNQTDVDYWVEILNEFSAPYYNETLKQTLMHCDYDRPIMDKKGCIVDTSTWGDCRPEMGYSYNRSRPCFFIKLNKIYGWAPEFYKYDYELPEQMPNDLKQHIKNINKTDPKQLNTIWVSCRGENPADVETIGPVKYVSGYGLPGYYFPFKNQENYLTPVIAIQLTNATKHVLINVECRAWAKNIIYSKVKGEREGSMHLELMMD
ncbi:sodium/potassium-transporting ATPase subunit beta-2-like [Schistocerca nitens]|uniref:sodium/potassium-transporting ATPase subunit beta-2-like n=1 Tax=Schistocerca nitens TaxID=7011 RepID=UPI002118BF10|nr:sodium/potassium-transporting ATPase subunit beta-2-like [Schistocerca nitens]